MSVRDFAAEVSAMSKDDLVVLLEQAAQVLSDHGDDCRGRDEEASYRLECETVLRAAEIVGEADAPDLSKVSTARLLREVHRRKDILAMTITAGDLAEAWGDDHRLPEADEMTPTFRRAFEMWHDMGSYSDLVDTLREAWQRYQARQLDQEGGRA